jgi:hypothetical protein
MDKEDDRMNRKFIRILNKERKRWATLESRLRNEVYARALQAKSKMR